LYACFVCVVGVFGVIRVDIGIGVVVEFTSSYFTEIKLPIGDDICGANTWTVVIIASCSSYFTAGDSHNNKPAITVHNTPYIYSINNSRTKIYSPNTGTINI